MTLFSTLTRSLNARAANRVTDHFALDLIEQKIRDAEKALFGAKNTLATLILRQQQETKSAKSLNSRITGLEERARAALQAGNDILGRDAAEMIAQLENENTSRSETLDSLELKIARMQITIEKANRRIIDLRQGHVTAKAISQERGAQRKFSGTTKNTDCIQEAEALIKRVVGQEDPFEHGRALDQIEAGLSANGIEDKLADAGFGPSTKTTAGDVLARLTSAP